MDSRAVTDKILEATAAGMLVVLAGGNYFLNLDIIPYFPCSLGRSPTDGVLCVAATYDTKMQLTDESDFGSAVDIAAPGYKIGTTFLEGPEGMYGVVSGTSAAAAIVAGIAGMLYSLEPSLKAELTPAYIKSIIMDTATAGVKDSGGKRTLSFGRVNAAAAVNKILGRKKV
ncbi:thermitase, putative [Perkinsus marinus ATCC 50983]|uniref:subtilisin n=1 Tax=Perkinsus marinus (strain ATCC 50983 / TXsc) TaxID=423536 RepID=C5K656_PERM5|nr:thermitase, putative [Perkinsus marinus ATCC 50983]EER20086.1 thermitase, putative [Perkinsus marinus ATCC 50983]|eukprot:XP_002788290.1 thermitase, putative [Perkinsus marinus ATCC 50983]